MRRYRMCAAVLMSLVGLGCVVLPEAQLPEGNRRLVALDQGWIGADRALFYHESQGTVMVP